MAKHKNPERSEKEKEPETPEAPAPEKPEEEAPKEEVDANIAALQYVFENVRDRKIRNYVGRHLGHPIEEEAKRNSFELQGTIPSGGADGSALESLQTSETGEGAEVPSGEKVAV